MPRIIDYPAVLQQMTTQGFKSLYYNSGAFGFPKPLEAKVCAWIGPDDPTIREAARPMTRRIKEPCAPTLAAMAGELWQTKLPGIVWFMPMSHWAYELDHGSREWLPPKLAEMGIDATILSGRADGAAIEFGAVEQKHFQELLELLLTKLDLTDFMLAFPGRQTLCTVHHHKQLWWMTDKEAVSTAAESLALANAAIMQQ